MRTHGYVALLALLALGAAQAQTRPTPRAARPIRLLIQGDDMGAAHGMNTATIRAYKEGILRSTNVIVPGPWFLEAVELLQQNPGLDVGVHLCLTSEWDRLKWRPLTNAPSLVDADGYFFPQVWPVKGYPPNSSLKEADPKLDEVERELRRQIEVARRHIPRISYLSAHMGFPALKPEWRALVRRIADDTGIPLMESERNLNYLFAVWNAGVGARSDNGAARATKMAAKLEKLQPGTYIMVDHCGALDPEMQALSSPGYADVAADRAAVVEAWTSPQVLEVVKRRNIQLIGHASLPRQARQ
jgi:hypothetical protein